MRVPCARCGAEHDLSDLEPSYARPDPYLAVPLELRDRRTRLGKDHCIVRDPSSRFGLRSWLRSFSGADARYFVRVLLPVPVRGESRPTHWGVWAEVDRRAWRRISALWSAEDQAKEPPFTGKLVNRLATYPDTTGLPGRLQLTGPRSIPVFTLDSDLLHPLAVDQRSGVYHETVIEWLGALHP